VTSAALKLGKRAAAVGSAAGSIAGIAIATMRAFGRAAFIAVAYSAIAVEKSSLPGRIPRTTAPPRSA
jgi:hypothetical protein